MSNKNQSKYTSATKSWDIVNGCKIPYRMSPYERNGKRKSGYLFSVVETDDHGLSQYALPGGDKASIDELIIWLNGLSEKVLNALISNANSPLT